MQAYAEGFALLRQGSELRARPRRRSPSSGATARVVRSWLLDLTVPSSSPRTRTLDAIAAARRRLRRGPLDGARGGRARACRRR
ncbi:MAG: hypothetical protein MZW92_81915 [Comamonadaceae bacterium]|nr:hypothetical protein [Comamonadaceae bacterium]